VNRAPEPVKVVHAQGVVVRVRVEQDAEAEMRVGAVGPAKLADGDL
jgi:hypothetical protein